MFNQGPGGGGLMQQRPYNDIPETFDDSMSFQVKRACRVKDVLSVDLNM